jgi:hypothetical protein
MGKYYLSIFGSLNSLTNDEKIIIKQSTHMTINVAQMTT